VSEFKITKVQGFFRPHDGGKSFEMDIDPASVCVTNTQEYGDGTVDKQTMRIVDGIPAFEFSSEKPAPSDDKSVLDRAAAAIDMEVVSQGIDEKGNWFLHMRDI
jgi:hypothetical protein